MFVVFLFRKRNDIADIAWGPGFALLCWACLLIEGGAAGTAAVLCSLLVTAWAARLGLHIFWRNRGRPEDPRYHQWQKAWGKHWALRSYFQVYVLQAALMLVVCLPALAVVSAPAGGSFSALAAFGVAIFALGLAVESVADWQLLQFRRQPQNKKQLMTAGLWGLCRHPNYLGELMVWWGMWLWALAVSPFALWALAGPLVITVLLLKVSGIPMKEARMKQHPDFANYAKRVPLLLPRLSGILGRS